MNKLERIYLHIGMHKTGSSSIQSSFSEYDDGLTRYANIGGANHSGAITTIFHPNPYGHYIHIQRGRSKAEIDSLRYKWMAELSNELTGTATRLIISGESISKLPRRGVITLANYLRQFAHEVRIIAYVREPITFASSSFQQRVKLGVGRFEVPTPTYRARFQKYIDIFGRDSVEFANFDRTKLIDGCVVTDFAKKIGVDLTNIRIYNKNESLPLEVVSLLFHMNKKNISRFGSERCVKNRMKMINVLSACFTGCFLFSGKLVQRHLDKVDIRWMQQQMQDPFELSTFRDMPDEKTVADENDLYQAYKNSLDRLANILGYGNIMDIVSDHSDDEVLKALEKKLLSHAWSQRKPR